MKTSWHKGLPSWSSSLWNSSSMIWHVQKHFKLHLLKKRNYYRMNWTYTFAWSMISHLNEIFFVYKSKVSENMKLLNVHEKGHLFLWSSSWSNQIVESGKTMNERQYLDFHSLYCAWKCYEGVKSSLQSACVCYMLFGRFQTIYW